jgi:predicted nuclease of predicted toxin-antitoxin system
MKILADLHISPRTVKHLRSLHHDVVRVDEVLATNSPDKVIVEKAIQESRVILTQDLDFSEIIALSGKTVPSLISLRLSSSRIEYVNSRLERILPLIEQDVEQGIIVVVEDKRIRRRKLPLE